MTYDPIDTSASDDSADSTVTVDDIDTTVLQGLNLDDAPAGGEVRITEENGQTVFTAVPAGAFDITQLTLNFTFSSQGTNSRGVTFNNDGTKMYDVTLGDDNFHEYNLSTAFDLSTATFNQSKATTVLSALDIVFNDTGSKLYEVDDDGPIKEFSLTSNFDISTLAGSPNFTFNTVNRGSGMTFNDDGTKMYVAAIAAGKIESYTLGTAFDLSTASNTTTNSINSQDSLPQGIVFNNDGTKMYEVGRSSDIITERPLSTPFDISTAGLTTTISAEGSNPTGLAWDNVGSRLFQSESDNSELHEFVV